MPPSRRRAPPGVKVSYDTNLRLRLWDLDDGARGPSTPPSRVATSRCRASTIPSSSPACSEPDAIADYYLELGAPLVALKMGGRGLP